MRTGKIFFVIVITALFLLLLSALVVSPASNTVSAESPVSQADLNATFLPYLLPTLDTAFSRSSRFYTARLAVLPLLALLLLILPTLLKRDANGRVLCAKRYENSFYQVFRQEIAGG